MRSKPALGTLAIVATLIGCGTALAQECATRAQMNAELAEAIRTDSTLSGDGSVSGVPNQAGAERISCSCF
jgi:hypothetical protein